MIKIDLHTHTADDPADAIAHSTDDLIELAAALDFGAIAVTLHDRQLDLRRFEPLARQRGVVLIQGIERTINGKHVLLLNFPAAAVEQVQTLGAVAALKRAHPAGLVVAPHPFYPSSSCLRSLMDRHAALFDAVEQNYFYTRAVDFNGPARQWAARHGKPIVGNADLHRLYQLGRTYTLVNAPPDADAICEAVRQGRVEVVSEPISTVEAATYFADLLAAKAGRAWRHLWPQTEPAAA